jgi:hypothetical protein
MVQKLLWGIVKLPFNLLLRLILPGKKDGRTLTGYSNNKKPWRL